MELNRSKVKKKEEPHMPVHNEEIARAFDEMADLLSLQDANPFRILAYRRAAQSIRGQRRELAERFARDEEPEHIAGIGKDLAGKMAELIATGRLRALETLRRQVPPGLIELMAIPGLGPKRVRTLFTELKVRGRADLERVTKSGALAQVAGFGPKLIAQIANALEMQRPEDRRWLRSDAARFAEPLAAYLREVDGVNEVMIAGSYRRGRDTVGDIDIVVSAKSAEAVGTALHSYDEISSWAAEGGKRLTAKLRSGLQIDIRIGDAASVGAAQHYFTGSKAHVIHIRRLAQERKLKVNEYGVFRGRRLIAGDTEESVFASLGLPWIPAELREDRGEIELAGAGKLPVLVTRKDLRGDLHAHTNASDGRDDLRAMALAARAAGLEYLAITDHGSRLGILHGLDERRVRQQMDAIDRLNEELVGLKLLKGIEVDILEDGSLALPDSLLAELDVVIGAVHGHFDLSESRQTMRVLRAMDRRAFSILAHPSGRLIGERAPLKLDFERVLKVAKARPCFVELDSQPKRLDLDDLKCRLAREQDVLVSIVSDAHSAQQFDYLEGGILQARRGWLTPGAVLNTRSLAEVRRLLKSTIV
jgi:DNA polymerase (family 10)